MSFLSSSGGQFYEFDRGRRIATKARNDGTIQSIRASEPLAPGQVHQFAFRVDKWAGGDIDLGFGSDCGSKLAWLRQNEQAGGDSRWRGFHFADALSPSLLKHLLKAEKGAAG